MPFADMRFHTTISVSQETFVALLTESTSLHCSRRSRTEDASSSTVPEPVNDNGTLYGIN